MIDLIVRKAPPAGLRPILRRSLEATMRHFGVADREVTVVLVGDRAIRALKLEHWDEDAATDVLSFPTWEPGDPFVPPHLGDIVISLDTARRQADARGHSLTREVALLASHGMTHLTGHDHPHAEGLGFEEGATGPEWQIFHDAWEAARSALPPGV
ncbi:rRNA maturation RNase YbeY [Deinococcus deserti]|uniref:Endoribonuclease YbeY n=1 Tax=Deinococcus deserti (strain DSM 17065 / CIP 109153 / LMG 22923 / VCD115) TaxID=546414 RepID=C1CUV1_DEIDV|nr:rRNA maturation RNase YbeY [Deinococcus deserti]ACO45968.1 putative metal-dependent hydrolase (metalloprotease) [Deinococcus deserti VCD115]